MKDAIITQEGKEITLGDYVQTLIDKATKLLQDKRNEYVAIQALWDGDTQGWWLDLGLVCKQSPTSNVVSVVFVPEGKNIEDFKSNYATSNLASMRFGSDIRLFNGTVPPYPEAWVAQQVGEALEERYGLPFYFPSPDKANDDCPRWWEQHLGIHCADCGKLVIPSDSPHMMKDVCYHCQLNRESNAKITEDKPKGSGVTLHVHTPTGGAMLGAGKDGLNYDIIDKLLQKNTPENRQEGVVWVTEAEIKACLPAYEQWLQAKLDAYFANPEEEQQSVRQFKKAISKGFFLGYVQTYTFECLGKKYELELSIRGELREYVEQKELLEQATEIILVFKDFVTYRDTSFTHFLRSKEGTCNIDDFKAHFQKILPEAEIQKTLDKLVSNGYVMRQDELYTITQKGRYI